MKKFLHLFKRFIPGIISGGADNDPAGITTYAVSGAQFGYQQLWLMVLATPMLIAVQAMCVRLGAIKKQGLTTIIASHYSPFFVVACACILIVANVLTIGADMIGIAVGFELITSLPYYYFILPTALVILGIMVFGKFPAIRGILLMLNVVFFGYIVSAVLSRPDWTEVLHNITFPSLRFSLNYLLAAVGLLGTTITPYLFYWQVQEEVEEHDSKKESAYKAKYGDMIMAPGFIFSNIISMCIMIATASVLYNHGVRDIQSAADAARALEPFMGPAAKYLFALGIVGAGFLAIPVLASTASASVAEVFHWRDSLSLKLDKAKQFYAGIAIILLVGVGVSLIQINPIHALFYSQIVNGMLGPLLIILLLVMCNDKKIMGTHVNSWFDNVFGGLAVLVMVAGTIGIFWQLQG
jgi:NRAMP (natural resistance-associated macrophage protein)-like metal ion transporter